MSFTTPDSFVESKYYIQFDPEEDYIDVSGTVGSYAVTSAGKVPMISRNRDYTLTMPTMSVSVYSTTEIERGMFFKASRVASSVETVLFRGIIDEVIYDEDKDEYKLKILHEFKLLQYYRVRKSKLEEELTSTGIIYICKHFVESALGVTFDITEVENYSTGIVTLKDVNIEYKVLWCYGLNYASSDPDEDSTATYWDFVSETMGILGLVMDFTGTEYHLKHNTESDNYDESALTFVDDYKKSYVKAKSDYVVLGIDCNYNTDLTTYDTAEETELTQSELTIDTEKPRIAFSVTDNFYAKKIVSTVNRVGGFKVAGLSYYQDYYKEQFKTDFDNTTHNVLTKFYDPVFDRIEVEQHIPYTFTVDGDWYYFDGGVKQFFGPGSKLKSSDAVYLDFSKKLSIANLDNAYISLTATGARQSITISFINDSKTFKIAYNSLPDGNYGARITKDVCSITGAKLGLNSELNKLNVGFTIED